MAVPVALVAFIVDDSGSMRGRGVPTCEAFNAYVDVLKKTKGAEIKFSVYKLSGYGRESLQANAPIQDASELKNGENYKAHLCNTPLWETITNVVGALDAELGRVGPRKVVICIQTDGGDPEDHGKCAKLVKDRMARGWEFIWMGTGNGRTGFGGPDVSCMRGAELLGIPGSNQIRYGDGAKTLEAFKAAAWAVGSFSSGRAEHASFTVEQQKKAG